MHVNSARGVWIVDAHRTFFKSLINVTLYFFVLLGAEYESGLKIALQHSSGLDI